MKEPTLAWPSRGQPVERDATTGRWLYAPHPGRTPRLETLRAHGHPAARTPDLLILGEAHAALRALAAAKRSFRLCYIDPPYNTGQEFAAYDDRAGHDVWLACLDERARLCRTLLAPGGFFCAHVNVVEQAYLKVLLDEIFGRDQLVAQIAWQRAPDRTVLGQGSALVTDQVEYLLVYGNGPPPRDWPRPQRKSPLPERTLATYSRTLVPSPGATLVTTFADSAGGEVRVYAHHSYQLRPRPAALAPAFPHVMRLTNQQPESTFQQALIARMPKRNVLYRAEYAQRTGKHRGARVRHYLNGNVVLWLRDVATLEGDRLIRVADLNNFWTAAEIPATGIAGEGGVVLRRGKKPERLLERVISAFSRPGEHVLDFFAGSGTTGAVAHRLGRGFVLVEAGPPGPQLAEPRLHRAGAAFVVARLA